MSFKALFTKLATMFGRSTESSDIDASSTSSSSPQTPPCVEQSPKKSLLTDHFLLRDDESHHPEIVAKYDRALALIQKLHDCIAKPLMFCYRSGDWYILEVEIMSLWSDDSWDCHGARPNTHAVYVVDMSRDLVIQQGDFDALKPVFETLKAQKMNENYEEDSTYLRHITTLLMAPFAPGQIINETSRGLYFPEEFDIPKYEIHEDSLVYNWFECSGDMNHSIRKHTITWDGKTANHQAFIIPLPDES